MQKHTGRAKRCGRRVETCHKQAQTIRSRALLCYNGQTWIYMRNSSTKDKFMQEFGLFLSRKVQYDLK